MGKSYRIGQEIIGFKKIIVMYNISQVIAKAKFLNTPNWENFFRAIHELLSNLLCGKLIINDQNLCRDSNLFLLLNIWLDLS